MDKEDRFKKGLPVSAVPETLRIRFTRELNDLREGNVSEVNFPPTLSTVERKFLHKLAQELGLTSKSRGKDENRYITVTKSKKAGTNNEEIVHPFFDINGQTKAVLDLPLSDYKRILSSIRTAKLSKKKTKKKKQTSRSLSRFAPVDETAAHFQQRQSQRLANKDYVALQKKRQSLPSHSHRSDVVSMVRNSAISLISGDTGCGKMSSMNCMILFSFVILFN